MVKYSLNRSYECRECHKESIVQARLGICMTEWVCDKCGALNHVFIDIVRFRVGSQLFRAGQDFIDANEFDLGAVLLEASVDASLGVGIRELMIRRAIESRKGPPCEDEIYCKLRRMNYDEKKAKFEQLAGATMSSEIERLHREGKISGEELHGYETLIEDIKMLGLQRNHFVHMGESVDEEIVRKSVPAVKRAVFLLEAMYSAVYNLKRPSL